jgi:hypothetical protein
MVRYGTLEVENRLKPVFHIVVFHILKPVFHFNRIVTYRSIFFFVEVISSTLVLRKQRSTLRFATIRLKWKTGIKPVFRIVSYRSEAYFFVS